MTAAASRRNYAGPLRAAILDWAGTTVDYGCCAPAIVFMDVFKKHGVEISVSEARGPMGSAKREHIAQIAAMPRVAEGWKLAHGRASMEGDIDRMYADFIPMQVKCIKDYADIIPGTIEAIASMRARGMKIGATTGYSREMMDELEPIAAKQGYAPDVSVTASDVAVGRPAPWMAVKCLIEFNVFPAAAAVKIGDTVPDIGEGLNGGMWTVAVAKTGNEVGLSLPELEAADPAELERRLTIARAKLRDAGAHYVVDGIEEVASVIDRINERLAAGEKP